MTVSSQLIGIDSRDVCRLLFRIRGSLRFVGMAQTQLDYITSRFNGIARKIARGLYDRYEARHAPPPPPMLDLNRLEDLRNILRFEQKAPAARD